MCAGGEGVNKEHQAPTLSEYIATHGKAILGSNCLHFQDFPVLIKLIDAQDNLSIQVHPDNAYALEHEKQFGKTEMWYVVDALEGSLQLATVSEESAAQQEVALANLQKVLNEIDRD